MRAAKDAGVKRVIVTSSTVTLPLTLPGAPAGRRERLGERPARALHARQDRGRAARLGAGRRARARSRDGAARRVRRPGLPAQHADHRFHRGDHERRAAARRAADQLPLGRCPRRRARAPAGAGEGRAGAGSSPSTTVSRRSTEIAQTMHAIDPAIPRPLMTLPAVPDAGAAVARGGWRAVVNGAPRSLTPELARHVSGPRLEHLQRQDPARARLGAADQHQAEPRRHDRRDRRARENLSGSRPNLQGRHYADGVRRSRPAV